MYVGRMSSGTLAAQDGSPTASSYHTCAVDLLCGGRIVGGDVQRHVLLLIYCRGSSAEPAALRRGVDVGVAPL